MTTTTVLIWSVAERSSGHHGKAGKVTLFTIHWLGGEKPWVLRTALPGISKRWRGPSVEALQATAEMVLAKWLDAIGAQIVPVDAEAGQ